MQVVSLSTSKSGPEIRLALGTWAGTEMGGFKQLDTDLPVDSLEQLEKDFSLAVATRGDTEAELSDDKAPTSDGTDTAGNNTAAAARKVISTSDDALDALCNNLTASTQQALESQLHLFSQLRHAQGCIEITNACTGIGHPAEAVNKGRKGSCLIIADVGSATTLGNLGVHKRIPRWVLPNNMLTLHTWTLTG